MSVVQGLVFLGLAHASLEFIVLFQNCVVVLLKFLVMEMATRQTLADPLGFFFVDRGFGPCRLEFLRELFAG